MKYFKPVHLYSKVIQSHFACTASNIWIRQQLYWDDFKVRQTTSQSTISCTNIHHGNKNANKNTDLFICESDYFFACFFYYVNNSLRIELFMLMPCDSKLECLRQFYCQVERRADLNLWRREPFFTYLDNVPSLSTFDGDN